MSMFNFKQTLSPFQSAVLGIESLFDDFELVAPTSAGSYPHHNLIKIPNGHLIELAVAGFDMKDLSVNLHGGILTVTGNKAETEKEDTVYVWKGVATRKFTKCFRVGNKVTEDQVHALNKNGVLKIEVFHEMAHEYETEIKIENED